MKNNGQLPADLIDAVQPVLDQAKFYYQGTRETFPATATINVLAQANYAFPEFIVPAGELWYVHAYTFQLTVPAAQTWAGYPIHYTNNILPIEVGARDSAGAAAVQLVQSASIGGFFASPGDRFGLVTAASTGAGAINATGFLTISRFPL